jgi:hypothetical protein
MDFISKRGSSIKELWTDSRNSLGKKAWKSILLAIPCVQVLAFCLLATISLFLAFIGMVFPKTAEQGRALLNKLERRQMAFR